LNKLRREVIIVSAVAELIEPALQDLGFELVRVQFQGGARRVLQVMAEPLDREHEMTVDDCALISRSISAILDVADPIEGAYSLEVSSPGLDRPLVKREDFERFAGLEARIEVEPAIEGRKRWKGRLGGNEADTVVIDVDGRNVGLPFSTIRKAKLILTDELIAEGLRR
jgi:ribosome maturation factor RimP